MSMKLMIKRSLKKKLQKILRISDPYEFKHVPAIKRQEVTFQLKEKEFKITSDGSTPLYETISEILEYDCYFLKQMDFSKFDKNSVALDIGGNIGTFSMVLSAFFPGKIICIEPLLENCRFIEMNLKNNNISNVEVFPYAVCLSDQKLTFYKNFESVSGSLINYEGAAKTEVEGISVDRLLGKFSSIDLIKLDCEGSEYDIVPEILKICKSIKYITGEIHKCGETRGVLGEAKDVDILLQLLHKNGYETSTKPDLFNRAGLTSLFAKK